MKILPQHLSAYRVNQSQNVQRSPAQRGQAESGSAAQQPEREAPATGKRLGESREIRHSFTIQETRLLEALSPEERDFIARVFDEEQGDAGKVYNQGRELKAPSRVGSSLDISA